MLQKRGRLGPTVRAAGSTCQEIQRSPETGTQFTGIFYIQSLDLEKADWVASSLQEKMDPQDPTVRMGSRGRPGTRGGVRGVAGLVVPRCLSPPPPAPCVQLR